MKDFKIIDPKKVKKNKLSKDELRQQKIQCCANEVNDIMVKYDCRFAVQTIYEDGKLAHQQILIRENPKEKPKDETVH